MRTEWTPEQIAATPAELEAHETLVREARGWISDCYWADLPGEDVAELSPAEVLAGVQRNYCGGLEAFLADTVELLAELEAPELTDARAALLRSSERRPGGAYRLPLGALGVDVVALYGAGLAFPAWDADAGESFPTLTDAGELERARLLRAPVRTRWDVGGLTTAEALQRLEREHVCPKR